MTLKTNLHFHTSDDPEDRIIKYGFYEGIDKASELQFGALAITCHNKYIDSKEYEDYAASKNVLLIPGIEKTIEGRHVVILNASKAIEKVKTFNELRGYKKQNPDTFVMAPHPYFYIFSLNGKLAKNIDLFDAIEYSWFYSKILNPNIQGQITAEKYNLPFIATSDTHNLDFINSSFAFIETEEKTIPALFAAIRKKKIKNENPPKKFWREMVGTALEIAI